MYKISNLFPFNKMVATNPSFGISAQKLDAKYDNHYNLGISMRPSLSVDKFERNKISFGAGMEEKKITQKDINAKLAELYMVGITEPEYAKTTVTPGEDIATEKIEKFYDENKILRKEVATAVSGYISSVTLFDEKGRETYFAERTFKNDSVPMLHLAKYHTSYENNIVSKNCNFEDYKISELDI